MATIKKRGEQSYLVRVFLGRDLETGRRLWHTETVHGRKKTAEARARELEERKSLGPAHLNPSDKPLRDYLREDWLPYKRQLVGGRTAQDYEWVIERYFSEGLPGKLPLARLTPLHLQALYSQLLQQLDGVTVQKVHLVLHQALDHAVRMAAIPESPAARVDPPRRRRKTEQEVRPLNLDQVQAFLEAITGDRYEEWFRLDLDTGARPAELLGLQWPHVNQPACEIQIVQSLRRMKGGGWTLEPCKTPQSRRVISVDRETILRLRRHHQRQLEERLAWAGPYRDHGFVFTAYNGEPLNDRNLDLKHFKPALDRAGLPSFRLYDLRHTHATLLFQAGEDLAVVSKRLGHASIRITHDTYTAWVKSRDQGCIDGLRRLLIARGDQEAIGGNRT